MSGERRPDGEATARASARRPARAWADAVRPYRAAFFARFSALFEYRAAALAGVATQLWWGGIKVMGLAAFYASRPDADAALTLRDAITYTWTAQAVFALVPWTADPQVAQAVRTGSVAFDGVRPVDPYLFWYARSAGWLAARTLPRALLLCAVTALVFRALGLEPWAWQAPASLPAAAAFCFSMLLGLLLSTAVLMLLNVAVVVLLEERGVNALAAPVMMVLTGNVLPLGLYPSAIAQLLVVQPLAGVFDIPLRIYQGAGAGSTLVGLGLQSFWTIALVLAGRAALGAALRRLDVQGG